MLTGCFQVGVFGRAEWYVKNASIGGSICVNPDGSWQNLLNNTVHVRFVRQYVPSHDRYRLLIKSTDPKSQLDEDADVLTMAVDYVS